MRSQSQTFANKYCSLQQIEISKKECHAYNVGLYFVNFQHHLILSGFKSARAECGEKGVGVGGLRILLTFQSILSQFFSSS